MSKLEQMKEDVLKNDWIFIDGKLLDEPFLFKCLVQNHKKEYVTYLYNADIRGFAGGHYFSDGKSALSDYEARS